MYMCIECIYIHTNICNLSMILGVYIYICSTNLNLNRNATILIQCIIYSVIYSTIIVSCVCDYVNKMSGMTSLAVQNAVVNSPLLGASQQSSSMPGAVKKSQLGMCLSN